LNTTHHTPHKHTLGVSSPGPPSLSPLSRWLKFRLFYFENHPDHWTTMKAAMSAERKRREKEKKENKRKRKRKKNTKNIRL